MAFTIKRKPCDKGGGHLGSLAPAESTPLPPLKPPSNSNDAQVSALDSRQFLVPDLNGSSQASPSLISDEDVILPATPVTPELPTNGLRHVPRPTIHSSPVSLPPKRSNGEKIASRATISWGINWRKPMFIWTLLFGGLILALGHHFYYLSLNGTRAGDAAKQAWPIRFGTAFAFLVTSCLQACTATAIGQHVWSIVRRKSLTSGTWNIAEIHRKQNEKILTCSHSRSG
jgi:hypothetical protein